MKILIIGGGNMGMTYARSFLQTHVVSDEDLIILEKSSKKARELKKLKVGLIYGKPGEFFREADLIILAVKPQDCNLLFRNIKHFTSDQQVVLSIMAGVKMETIQRGLQTAKVIRAMPNLPAQVGEGMTVFSSTADVTRIELVMVQNLLNATGKTLYTTDERMIDAATAISGSGPAYVFYFMQTMIDAATNMGFSQSESELMTYQTFKGAVELFNQHNYNCFEWINKVSSKGGTTEAAFSSFNSNGIKDKISEGLLCALKRAEELSQT